MTKKYLKIQRLSLDLMTVSRSANETPNNIVAPERNATRLTKCFLGNDRKPLERDNATGDTKSASGPASRRDTVFAIERMRTCVEVAASVDESSVMMSVEDDGRDKTMVPMFEITISH